MQNIQVLEAVVREWATPHVRSLMGAFMPNMQWETPKFLTALGLPNQISLANEMAVIVDPFVNSMFGKIGTLSKMMEDKDIPAFASQVVDNMIEVSKKTGTFDMFGGILMLPTATLTDLKTQLEGAFGQVAAAMAAQQEVVEPATATTV